MATQMGFSKLALARADYEIAREAAYRRCAEFRWATWVVDTNARNAAERCKPGSLKWFQRAKEGLEKTALEPLPKARFIPPSTETLEWGGFLGGEFV